MRAGPARGLPPRIYVPIVIVAMAVLLGVIGYFLRIGLGVTGAALGPEAQQGDAVLPQTGGNGVGGGTPVPANAGAVARPAGALTPPPARHARRTT
ncbi:MAG: hypothetical protein GIX03_01240 [Candidatus Eremiobacteraeota bacterium]|nr:hypothetical protein [Candidatus Eremiobacteraeota bacterium]MBC5801645.1 hypothetical protein [Candidatus Eremiobacteraeota bacterium]MBC5822448.1 hypothetical protein [Candidatus Eremiobacteraeota bacterium]